MSSYATSRLGFMITSLEGGGAERVVSNLARDFDDHDRNLVLFEDDLGYPFDGDVHVVDIPVLGEGARSRRALQMMRGLVELRRLRRSLRLDTCVSFLTWPNLYNVLSAGDERVVISVRSNPSRAFHGPFAPVIETMIRAVYPRADHVVAISEDVKHDLVDDFGVDPADVTTIYNPIRLQEVRDDASDPLPDGLDRLDDYPTVVSIGRLALPKGHWHLIRAFDRLRDDVDDARLVLLGVGPLQSYLVELARRLALDVWTRDDADGGDPLDHDVVFWGFADNPFPILAASDVFAFPSLWEGLGNVIIESLACGVPVVSADCHSGPREILAPDTPCNARTDRPEWADFGVLLPVCDGTRYDHTAPLTDEEQTWAKVLGRLLEDPSMRRRYALRGDDRAADFAIDDITRQWRRLLEPTPLWRAAQ